LAPANIVWSSAAPQSSFVDSNDCGSPARRFFGFGSCRVDDDIIVGGCDANRKDSGRYYY